jgi:hypothetical protein
MSTTRITRKKLPDPFAAEIAARLAARKAKEKREPVTASPVGVPALYDGADFMRAHPVTVLIMEARL